MNDRDLAIKILIELQDCSKVFSNFQNKSKLLCPPDCGKCCEHPEISCAPYELLPLAFHLLDLGHAEKILDQAKSHSTKTCIFLINNRCTAYKQRPYICRAFGVFLRQKKTETEFSICKTLKEIYPTEILSIENFDKNELAYIELLRKRFESIDPRLLETQVNINQALIIILEQILLKNSLGIS